MERDLFVALGARRYRIERPWGELPDDGAIVSDVVTDRSGRVYVYRRTDSYVDAPASPVVVLDQDGRRVAAWGQELIQDAHFLGCAADGRLFLVDRDAHEIVICDASGQRLGGLGRRHQPLQPFNHPSGVAIAPNGEVYVADGYSGSLVHRFAADGTRIGGWGEPGDGPGQFSTPHAVEVMADGRIAVADRENHRVQIFTPEGRLLAIWGGFHKPMDLWCDPAGCLHVTDQVPRLSLLSPMGELIGRCRPVLNGAHGISGDGQGRLYLAEISPSRITRLVPVD